MKLLLNILTFACLVISANFGLAAEIVLRGQTSQHSSIIRLGDVADIAASTQAEMHNLSKTPLLPAPAPGTRQFVTMRQIRDLLIARGMQDAELRFSGAKVVELGEAEQKTKAMQPEKMEPVGNKSHSELTSSDLQQEVTAALQDHLVNATDHHGWRVEFALNEKQSNELRQLVGELRASSARPPRHGKQRFELFGADGRKLWLMVDVTKFQDVVVAKQAIERGQLIRRSDLQLKQLEGNLPSGVLTELETVVGKQAERNLRVDQPVQETMIRAPWQIRRGETVSVFVRTGSIVVRTRAIAKQDGAMGELVALETIETKQRLDATVTGPGEAVVYASGGSAADYASLNRDTVRR